MDDQEFHDRAFLAALGGFCASAVSEEINDLWNGIAGGRRLSGAAKQVADTALTVRQERMKEKDDPTGMTEAKRTAPSVATPGYGMGDQL